MTLCKQSQQQVATAEATIIDMRAAAELREAEAAAQAQNASQDIAKSMAALQEAEAQLAAQRVMTAGLQSRCAHVQQCAAAAQHAADEACVLRSKRPCTACQTTSIPSQNAAAQADRRDVSDSRSTQTDISAAEDKARLFAISTERDAAVQKVVALRHQVEIAQQTLHQLEEVGYVSHQPCMTCDTDKAAMCEIISSSRSSEPQAQSIERQTARDADAAASARIASCNRQLSLYRAR